MPNFFESGSYWHGGFTEDQQKWYKEHRLSQEGIHLWKQIHQLYEYAKNLCSIYNTSFCRDESCCFMRHQHLAFQCEYNEDETLASYAKRNYDFYDAEQIEEFVAFKGAYEITSFLENIDDAPYKSESLAIYFSIALKITMTIIILLIILREYLLQRKRIMFCRTLWKKKLLKMKAPWIKKEEESDEQKEEEWSYPCLPSNESNSLNLTLYECYYPMDYFEISLFGEVDAFYAFDQDAIVDVAYEDELSIVPYIKHEIFAIAP